MEIRAHIKYVRMSPTKLRTLVDDLKTMSAQVALDRLSMSQKRSAKAIYKALKSAVANGQSIPGFNASKATIKILAIDEGPYLKRYRAGSRGTAKPFVRKSSHITVILEQKGLAKAAKPAKVKADKKAQTAKAPVAAKKPELKKAKVENAAKPAKQTQKKVTSQQRTTSK